MKSTLHRLVLTIAAGFFLAFTGPQLALAQDVATGAVPGASQYTNDYGRAGYPRVRVYLWGNARNGVWTVEEGTDLLEFLSVVAQGNFNQSADTRSKNVLLMYRKGQIDQEPVFEMRMEKIFARQVDFPTLQNGDVLVVQTEQRRRYLTFRSISQAVGTVSSVFSLVYLLTRD